MKKIMLMAAALSFYGLSAQEFDDHQSDNQEIEAIGAAENAVAEPSAVAAEQQKQQEKVAQLGNEEESGLNDAEDTEE
ncbi:MAG TPA: hypothetical protein VLE96_06725 [Chlamydiales bacterium]|nr:hypothetical protein [Chlamydiales bacterium]